MHQTLVLLLLFNGQNCLLNYRLKTRMDAIWMISLSLKIHSYGYGGGNGKLNSRIKFCCYRIHFNSTNEIPCWAENLLNVFQHFFLIFQIFHPLFYDVFNYEKQKFSSPILWGVFPILNLAQNININPIYVRARVCVCGKIEFDRSHG